jgi:hypothetical protein
VALSGVNLKEPVRVVFASSPNDQLKANDVPPMILDSIQLPSKMLLRNKSYVSNLYIKRDLSIREIARELNKRLVPTKNNGIWQAATVSKILEKVCT